MRGTEHALSGAVAFAAAAPLLHAAPAALAAGTVLTAGAAGDELTHSGCPVWYPFSRTDHHLLPHGLRFTTGKFAEHWIVSPLLLAGLALLLARDAGVLSR